MKIGKGPTSKSPEVLIVVVHSTVLKARNRSEIFRFGNVRNRFANTVKGFRPTRVTATALIGPIDGLPEQHMDLQSETGRLTF
jgi:hypothetical protein